MGDIEDIFTRLREAIAVAALAAALLGGLLATALTTRGLRPLRRLATGARAISEEPDAGRRLPAATTRDELGELSGALNRMLDALDRAREAERRLLADASHELRTPVTSLRGNAAFARRHGADDELLADLEADAERLARLVDDLLALEREAGAERPDAEVDLEAVIDAVVAAPGRTLDGMTVLLSSHQLAEVEELCDRVAIVRSGAVVYEGGLDELRAASGGGYRLRTTDDALAARVCRGQPGVSDVASGPDGIALRASEEDAGRLSVALVEAGIGILALVPRTATLEDVFFDLTEGAPSAPPHVTTVEEHA